MIIRPTSTHATVLGLVRQARASGEFTDEFALAALIDAEVDLEALVAVVQRLARFEALADHVADPPL